MTRSKEEVLRINQFPLQQTSLRKAEELMVDAKIFFSRFANYMALSFLVTVLMSCCIIDTVAALPFPAPKFEHCLNSEECCTPVLAAGEPAKFRFQTHLPMRIRPAAQLVDDAYIAKYQRAMERMRALPDTDGRSFTNQYKLHCVYCDNHLYFQGKSHPYPLEIHRSWLFFPWHRLYLYFHERILARLIDDDTFALPFWNWDNQSPERPQGNVVPRVYAEERSLFPGAINRTSALYDADRTECAKLPEGFVNFQDAFACPSLNGLNETAIRAANAHVLYVNMVGVGVTPLLFHGWPYRLGDQGGGGVGAIETIPHSPVHRWVNIKDMLTFKDSASDPIFFGHHANMDRLWELWKTLRSGVRDDISDPDYLDTEFSFYDEDGGVVTVSVWQALQIDRLRYKYQEVANPWLANGAVVANSKPEWERCNPKSSPAEIAELIENTKPLQGPVNFTTGPLTFKVRRIPDCSSDWRGEEILELRAEVDLTQFFYITAFAFLPEAQINTSIGCGEYLAYTRNSPHVGISQKLRPKLVWRMGIRRQLEVMGREHLEHIAVTLTGSELNLKNILFTDASVIYSKE